MAITEIALTENVIQVYGKCENLADPNTNWFLFNYIPIPTMKNLYFYNYSMILVLVSYFGYKVWPKIVKNPKLYTVPNLLTFYDSIQFILNTYLLKKTIELIWENSQLMLSFEIPGLDSSFAIKLTLWFFVIDKLMYVIDMVFVCISRKDFSVKVLYQHALILGGCLFLTRYFPNGQFLFIGVLNSFVHILLCTFHLFSLSEPLKNIGLLPPTNRKTKKKGKKLKTIKKKVKTFWKNSAEKIKRKKEKKLNFEAKIDKIKRKFKKIYDMYCSRRQARPVSEERREALPAPPASEED